MASLKQARDTGGINLNKHKRFLLIAFLSISALLIILFGIFTRPKYIPYEDGLIGTVNRNEAGIVDISFCTSATNYQLKANSQGEYTISLYTTAWDDIVKNKKEITNITFDTTKNEVKSIYYVSCGMADDVLMYGQSSPIGNRRTLPNLLLVSITRFMIKSILVLGLVALLLSRLYVTICKFLKKIILLEISWLLSQLFITGYDLSTFTPIRDLCMIALLTTIIFLIFFTCSNMLVPKKKRY